MDLLPCGPQWAGQRGAAAAQRNRLKAYAKEHGFEVVGTSTDIASGSAKYGYEKILKNLKNFCLGLDIWVPEAMEPDVGQSNYCEQFL